MKHPIKKIIPFFLGITLLTLSACEDMLETDSNRVAFENDNQIKNPDDAFYAINGILSELRKVCDRYIILGELRGDLMTIAPAYASVSLKEIYEFQTTEANAYSDQRDYYHVINNCNYALQKMDTSLVSRGEKIMLPAYAEIKAIRAWTYWQMAQVFGKVKYLEKPVLSLEASLQNYPEISIDDLANKLIQELAPYVDVRIYNDNQANISPDYSFSIQIPMLLGDIFLYQNQYVPAATMYFYLMSSGNQNNSPYLLTNGYVSKWTDKTFLTVEANHPSSYLHEYVSSILFSGDPRELYSKMINLTYNDKASLLPDENFIKTLRNTTYVDVDSKTVLTTTQGDLRGYVPTSKDRVQTGDAYYYIDLPGGSGAQAMIHKFYGVRSLTTGYDPDNSLIKDNLAFLSFIHIFRQPQLYLRYAEAVNRAGKPTLAYSVLKHGLTWQTVNDPKKVSPQELTGEYYTHITRAFDNNVGTMSRGLGANITSDSIYHVIPSLATLQDSVEWVESRILDELAAETAFEGNRFFDLLCVSRHRPNHPEFMAGKVSAKYPDPAAMKARLMHIENWFMKCQK